MKSHLLLYKIHPALNKPLLLFIYFICSFAGYNTVAQTVTLYTYPPTHPYHWRHPNSLLLSTIRNFYFSPNKKPVRLIGHMVIELKKDTSVLLTAISADELDVFSKSIKKDKIGLGVFFQPVPGHLEEHAELSKELTHRTQQSRAAFISFTISDSAFQYLQLYMDSFKLKGYDKLYNGLNSPRSGEGSGCTAFGMSFLELINAISPEFRKQWAVKVNIPEKLIGDTVTKKRVSTWNILFSFRWAKKNKPSRYLDLYEPGLIYQWVNNIYDSEQKNPTGRYKLKTNGTAKGLEVNCMDCIPQYPMFLKKAGIKKEVDSTLKETLFSRVLSQATLQASIN